MSIICDTLEEIGNSSSLEISIEYKYWPGEPMVLYYKNGDGYPGSPSYAELLSVYVTRWDVGDDERPRTDASIWDGLDEIAFGVVEGDWDRYEGMCLEDASEREERW